LRDDEDPDKPTFEEQIELERQKVRGGELLTAESFARWKKAKEERKASEEKKREDETRAAVQQGRNVLLSGRQLLIYRPTVFVDDEEALASAELERMTEQEYDAMLNAADGAPSESTAAGEGSDVAPSMTQDAVAAAVTATVEDASLFVDDDDDDDGDGAGGDGGEEGAEGEGGEADESGEEGEDGASENTVDTST